jgi:CARDB
VRGLARRHATVEASTGGLSGTGDMKALQPYLLQTMQLRTRGLNELGAALAKALRGDKVTTASTRAVSAVYARLLASDVVYEDFFRDPGRQILTDKGVDDAPLPASVMAQDPALADFESVGATLNRIKGGKGGDGAGAGTDCSTGAPKGTSLESVTQQPDGVRLVPNETTKVPTSLDPPLAFRVEVKNTGDCQVTKVKVKFTVAGTPTQVEEIKKLDVDETVPIDFVPPAPVVDKVVQITVSVDAVPGESNPANNSFQYGVEYSLGS